MLHYFPLIRQVCFILFCTFSILPARGQLHINEFQSSNVSTALDPSGNYREWVEIYNSGTSSINLKGYYLSSDLSNPFLQQIQNLWIGAESYALIWIDKTDDDPCCIFELNMSGGEIGLFSPSGELLDSVTYPQQHLDVSRGRTQDGSGHWSYFVNPTPRKPNNTAAFEDAIFPEELKFSVEGGLYQGNQLLELSTESNEGIIRYTRDGSWPTPSSPAYTDPILLTGTSVIRAGLFQEDKLPGKISTKTYILNESSTLPVVSIASDAKYFFDDQIGIYVEGTNGIPGNCSDDSVNWNQDWERPANVEYFTKEGLPAINQMVGVRLHGGCSRLWDYKSLALIARNKYGDNSLSHKFFKSKDVDEFKSIILRNSGNDAYYSMLRDGFMQSLLTGQMDLDCQGYQPANVFINGQYWGILNVREKINEHYPASNYDLHSDQIDMLERERYIQYGDVLHGSGAHYGELIDFVNENSLSEQANYEYVKTQMDVNEYLNLFLANIYFENEDWPQNNMKYWRPHVEGGKWRWILYDTDLGWGLAPRSGNTLEAATVVRGATVLIRGLLENEEFKNEFIQRMAGLINTTFNPNTVGPIYDSILGQISIEIQKHMDRWGRPKDDNYARHTETKIPEFTLERPDIVRAQVMDKFGISGMYNLAASVNDPGKGYIKASEVRLPDNFLGSFFMNVPLRLVAIPESGYTFSHWEDASTSLSQSIYLNATSDASIRAVFVPDSPISHIQINEICASNQDNARDEFGQTEDWIEIYNDNDFDVNMAGWYLSDSAGLIKKFRIPSDQPELTTVHAKNYLIIWCDNETRQGAMHANFKLKKEGEVLSLVQQINQSIHYVDSVQYPRLETDLTYGRAPESGEWEHMMPTPLAINEQRDVNGLFINEFMAKNSSTIADPNGEYDDWIEIYNDNDYPVDIGGLYITDSLAHLTKCRIPSGDSELTTIAAHGFIVLWADGQEEQGSLHLNFKLDGSGEEIGLVQPGGSKFIDSLSYNQTSTDMAIGRLEDGYRQIQIVSASPGASNYIITSAKLYISELSASGNNSHMDPSGEYDDWIEIYNDNDFEVNLGGLYITDSLGHLSKYRIPGTYPDSSTIGAKDYMILWIDNQPEQGINHVGFKLNGQGEQVALVDMDGFTIIDYVSFPNQYSNFTYSRANNTGNWKFLRPTPLEYNASTPVQGIYINEFMASNSAIPDEYGECDDWIELYNSNDVPVDIGGLYLTDSLGDPTQFRIPSHSPELTTIPSKSFFIFYADDTKEQGLNHTNFKLSRSGEEILLFHYDESTLLDSLSYPKQYKNSASGRVAESGSWYSIPPTPGESNLIPDLSQLVINEVMGNNKTHCSDEYNEYDDWIELYNSGDTPLDIGGLYLTDSLGDPTLFRISTEYPDSTTILPMDHLVLWADNSEEQGILHQGFKISKTGETIGLFDYTESLIDSTSYPFIGPNLSWGRTTDGDITWISFATPTPFLSNSYNSVHELKLNSNGVSVYPNPVTERAVFEIFLDEPSELIIDVIDSKGTTCSTLKEFHDGNGKQHFDWKVRDASGNGLESGFYICRIWTREGILISKLVVRASF